MHPTRINNNKNHPAIQLWRGFAIRETQQNAAVVNFRSGSVTGDILWPLNLSGNDAAGIVFDKDDPMETAGGIYVEIVAGTIVGTLFS